MATKVYLSTAGRALDPEQATVSVFDRGFLYGDSVYETMRTSGGRAVELQRHLARLRRSGAGIGFDLPFDDEMLTTIIAQTHAATANADSQIRVVVTRGRGEMLLDPRHARDPLLVVFARSLELPDEAVYRRGLRVVVVDAVKGGGTLVDPSVKSGNYLSSVLALGRAATEQADDAILCGPNGTIAEGATSNVFVAVEGAIRTPDLKTGLLAGITREVVCELAREQGFVVEEGEVPREQFDRAEEVFLTSSVRGLMPVTTIDGRAVGRGIEGPICARLREAYAVYLQQWARGERS